MFDRDHKEYTRESPTYGISKNMLKTVIIGTGLLLFNMILMVLLANTFVATIMEVLFYIPIIGVLVFGLFLTIGRHLSLKGLSSDSNIMALVGTVILLVAYGSFGAGILSRYSEQIWLNAMTGTFGVVLLMTIIATIYVTSTNRDLEFLGGYSGIIFIIGILLALVGSFWEPILLLAFIAFIIGFTLDLFYELWLATSNKRTPIANGVAVYVAMAGLFVHILQIVLELLADQ